MNYLLKDIDLITSVFFIVFFLSFLVQMIYYLFIFSRARKINPPLKKDRKKFPAVSLIICARNEAKNLSRNLPAFLEQDYPEFEVIVVNDCSEDETTEVLDNLEKEYSNLKICTIKKDRKFSHGKKLALTIGIKSAKHNILLLTDADCSVENKQWIKYMARNYQDKKEIVLGIGLYKKRRGLLNLLIRYETAFIAMQYISMARIGRPYMGVGRNLSYKKQLFFDNRGFASHLKLESGDDDLFISEVCTRTNTTVENHPESFSWSEPETKFRNWLKQKKRHLTTGKFYQQSVKRILGLEYLTRILLVISFLLLLFKYEYYLLPVIVYILSLIIKSIINILVFKGFNEKFIFLPSILIEIFIPILYSYLHFTNYIERKRSRWQ